MSNPIIIFSAVSQVVFETGQNWFARAQKWLPTDGLEDGPCAKSRSGAHQPVQHMFSCELSRPLQDWILSAHSPTVLVPDICTMDKKLVYDVKTSQHVVKPDVRAVFCGWVCHNVFPGCTCMRFLCMTSCVFVS